MLAANISNNWESSSILVVFSALENLASTSSFIGEKRILGSTAATWTPTESSHVNSSECSWTVHVIAYLGGNQGRWRTGLHHGKTKNFKLNVRDNSLLKISFGRLCTPELSPLTHPCLGTHFLVSSPLTILLPKLRCSLLGVTSLSSPSLASESNSRPG